MEHRIALANGTVQPEEYRDLNYIPEFKHGFLDMGPKDEEFHKLEEDYFIEIRNHLQVQILFDQNVTSLKTQLFQLNELLKTLSKVYLARNNPSDDSIAMDDSQSADVEQASFQTQKTVFIR